MPKLLTKVLSISLGAFSPFRVSHSRTYLATPGLWNTAPIVTSSPVINAPADEKAAQNQDSNPKQQHRKLFTSEHGEEVLWMPYFKPPPGHSFVPAGNFFVTRHCRKLTSKVYAVYLPTSRRRPIPKQEGIYVPKEIHMKVKAQFEARRSKLKEVWLQDIEDTYPRMPVKDKKEIYKLVCAHNPFLKKPSTSPVHHEVRSYVQNQYTKLSTLRSPDEVTAAHLQKAQIIASWRSEHD